jgi:hypothetical protein
MIYRGACHCGAIGFAYTTARTPDSWSIRACQCAFCRAHGVLTTSDPEGSLSFSCTDPARLERYRFGLRTADFLICNRCGVYVGATMVVEGRRYGIISVNAIAPLPTELARPEPMSYEGENVAERGRRREQRWTPIAGGI